MTRKRWEAGIAKVAEEAARRPEIELAVDICPWGQRRRQDRKPVARNFVASGFSKACVPIPICLCRVPEPRTPVEQKFDIVVRLCY
ncbi:MAG: hypothetical protein H5T86_09230 [Armatimonadetes bacterium]|nr:hypothetical protein [Armatimonadota bacterium]